MTDMDNYSHYFPVGKKVDVGIPLPNADVFKDWAIIHGISEDLVSLQLSRDILPVNVLLHYGQILELRGEIDNSGYCCRAIIVSEGDARSLLLRLIGEIVSDELREFYRIDAFLPIKYFVSHEQNIDVLYTQWKERRARRTQRERERMDQRWTHSMLPEEGALPPEPRQESSEAMCDDAASSVLGDDSAGVAEGSWDTIIPLAANISGGGLRIISHQGFAAGEYVLLEILVPSPQRVVDVIGRIVFANRNYAVKSDGEYFNTGVQFVYLDERDRDAIITYISTIQLKRIRQLRERYLFRGALENDQQVGDFANSGINKNTLVVLVIIFIVLIGMLGNYFWRYAHEHPKGEIQRVFEDGVKQYQEQIKQK